MIGAGGQDFVKEGRIREQASEGRVLGLG
jgi:hypothetical protein